DKQTTKEIKMKLLVPHNSNSQNELEYLYSGAILYYQQPNINVPENNSDHYYQLTLSDDLWLQQAHDFGSFCFGIDGKYNLNSDGAPILSLVIKDNAGYRTSIAFGLSNKENNYMIRLAVEAVQCNIPFEGKCVDTQPINHFIKRLYSITLTWDNIIKETSSQLVFEAVKPVVEGSDTYFYVKKENSEFRSLYTMRRISIDDKSSKLLQLMLNELASKYP
ncbi:27064_t:CDS:2, partial [Racocetra persica]